ncbi:VOC family protein [Roseovarius indicus]|uniref:VOC family protein n=1 Tax=Roseovarius indicus TaxID=540747 RepID=UPI0007D9853F|nr:VOC family protein [Roseovarius indicus]OAO07803.1 glyoxalase [Roseovarius indicus]
MKARLHHINLSTEKVEEMDVFYREVLGLEATDEDVPALRNDEGVYAGDVAFVSDGHMHLHIARKDVQAGFRTGQLVNPVMKGHVAYRTDDLAAFKAHLEAEGVPFADWGDSAVAGWHQIYFYDPEGNVIEVHQKDG